MDSNSLFSKYIKNPKLSKNTLLKEPEGLWRTLKDSEGTLRSSGGVLEPEGNLKEPLGILQRPLKYFILTNI